MSDRRETWVITVLVGLFSNPEPTAAKFSEWCPRIDLGPVVNSWGIFLRLVIASLVIPGFVPEVMAAGRPTVTVGERVQTDRGEVMGKVDRGTRAFLGIPYAAPPTGALRFRAPAEVPPWQGALIATAFGPRCAQIDQNGVIPAGTSEDCLHLNVWSPDGPTAPRPVLVWIHGGGNFVGNARTYLGPAVFGGVSTDGVSAVLEQELVFVSVQHRLGALGYLSHPAADAEDPHGVSGNYGILDLIAALGWIQRNIERFGGDPTRVTLYGNSAGADNICALVASPLAAGLFRRAIMQSPFSRCEAPEKAVYQADVGARNVKAMGCEESTDVMGCLRALPVETVLRRQVRGNLNNDPRVYTYIADGHVLPASPLTMMNAGSHNDVDFIIGHTAQEPNQRASSITTEAAYENALRNRFGTELFEGAELYRKVLEKYPPSPPNYRDAFDRVVADENHFCATRRIVRAANKPGFFASNGDADNTGKSKVFRYVFSQPAENAPAVAARGAFHTLDVMYTFRDWNLYSPTAGEIDLSSSMRRYWASFARIGNPVDEDGIEWSKANATRAGYLDLRAGAMAFVEDPRDEICDFWDSVAGYRIGARGDSASGGSDAVDDGEAQP